MEGLKKQGAFAHLAAVDPTEQSRERFQKSTRNHLYSNTFSVDELEEDLYERNENLFSAKSAKAYSNYIIIRI